MIVTKVHTVALAVAFEGDEDALDEAQEFHDDLQRFCVTHKVVARLTLKTRTDVEPEKKEPPMLEAIDRFQDTMPDGIDSLTISHGDQSVTLNGRGRL